MVGTPTRRAATCVDKSTCKHPQPGTQHVYYIHICVYVPCMLRGRFYVRVGTDTFQFTLVAVARCRCCCCVCNKMCVIPGAARHNMIVFTILMACRAGACGNLSRHASVSVCVCVYGVFVIFIAAKFSSMPPTPTQEHALTHTLTTPYWAIAISRLPFFGLRFPFVCLFVTTTTHSRSTTHNTTPMSATQTQSTRSQDTTQQQRFDVVGVGVLLYFRRATSYSQNARLMSV